MRKISDYIRDLFLIYLSDEEIATHQIKTKERISKRQFEILHARAKAEKRKFKLQQASNNNVSRIL